MINWQPISTAPLDRDVLLYIEGVLIQGIYDKKYKKWRAASVSSHGCGCCGSDDDEPTHWAEINAPTYDPVYDSYKTLEEEVKEKLQHKRRGVIGHLLEDDARSILENESPAAHYLNGRKDLAEGFAGKLRDILKKVREIEEDE